MLRGSRWYALKITESSASPDVSGLGPLPRLFMWVGSQLEPERDLSKTTVSTAEPSLLWKSASALAKASKKDGRPGCGLILLTAVKDCWGWRGRRPNPAWNTRKS